jgi:hypothetical protein
MTAISDKGLQESLTMEAMFTFGAVVAPATLQSTGSHLVFASLPRAWAMFVVFVSRTSTVM